MTLPNHQTVIRLLRAKLLTLVTEADTPIKWWGEEIDPPGMSPGRLWLRERFVVTAEGQRATELNESLGIWYIDVVRPKGQRADAALAIAQTIADGFDAVHALTGSGVEVTLDRVQRKSDTPASDPWIAMPVSVEWRTYAATG